MKRSRSSKKTNGAVSSLDPVLRIEGRQTIEAADGLLADLKKLYEGKVDAVVNLDGVKDCSIATLQLFCSAAITAASSGRSLTFTSVDPELKAFIHAMGLHQVAPFYALLENQETTLQGAARAHHAS